MATQPNKSIRPRKYVVQHEPSGFFLALVNWEVEDWRFVPSVGAAYAFSEESDARDEAAAFDSCVIHGVY